MLAAALLAAGVLNHRRPVAQPGIDLGLIGNREGLRTALEPAGESALLLRLMNSLAGLLIDILARDLGMGYERVRKVFRAATSVAPDAYRICRRIDRARRLLVGSDATLADIAAELGYPTPFAFRAQFNGMSGSRRRPIGSGLSGGRPAASSQRPPTCSIPMPHSDMSSASTSWR